MLCYQHSGGQLYIRVEYAAIDVCSLIAYRVVVNGQFRNFVEAYQRQDRFFQDTPSHLFIFSVNNSAEGVVHSTCNASVLLSNVHFLPLDEHWELPEAAGQLESWVQYPGGQFGSDYRCGANEHARLEQFQAS